MACAPGEDVVWDRLTRTLGFWAHTHTEGGGHTQDTTAGQPHEGQRKGAANTGDSKLGAPSGRSRESPRVGTISLSVAVRGRAVVVVT